MKLLMEDSDRWVKRSIKKSMEVDAESVETPVSTTSDNSIFNVTASTRKRLGEKSTFGGSERWGRGGFVGVQVKAGISKGLITSSTLV